MDFKALFRDWFGVLLPSFQLARRAGPPYNHKITVSAWHPFKGHIFLGDQQGRGLVLEDECPFRCQHLLRHHHMISGAAYSRDGDFLLTASFDGSCALWSVPAYSPVHIYWCVVYYLNAYK